MSRSSKPAARSARAARLASCRLTNTLWTYLRGNGATGSVGFVDTGDCSITNCSLVNGSYVSMVAVLFMICNLLMVFFCFHWFFIGREFSLLTLIRVALVRENRIG